MFYKIILDCVSSEGDPDVYLVDDCTRECPGTEVDISLGGLRVRRVLDRIANERGL
jgi:hypothetical protein